jgi:penicillin-binding protein 2
MGWRQALLAIVVLLAGCAPPAESPPPGPTATVAPAEPPAPTPTPARPGDAARLFFDAWQDGRYSTMYDLLTPTAQAAIPRDLFVRRYRSIHTGIGELSVSIRVLDEGPAEPPPTTSVGFEVTRRLAIYGDLPEQNALPLVRDAAGAWQVDWSPALIFTGLTPVSSVRVLPDVPVRGRIVDRHGEPLADNGIELEIGVVPGDVKDEPALLAALSTVLDQPADTIRQRYQGGQPAWFMPLAVRPEGDRAALAAAFDGLSGVVVREHPARVYPLGAAAAQVVGYVAHLNADELRTLEPYGYDESDWTGRAGVEAWAEPRLAGVRGGAIQIVDSGGRVTRIVARKAAVPGEDVTLTLDARVQRAAFEALGERTGSAVVLDPRDNGLLALTSVPSFDPNLFVTGLSDAQWQQLSGPDRPLVLRATEAAYPTGSIFKVITLSAGMETGEARPTDTFDCGLNWTGLPGLTLHNWTAQGILRLGEALTQSCNPAFYEIGLRLDRRDPDALPTFARTFGLGRATGIAGVNEVAGTVPDAEWKLRTQRDSWSAGDAVNLAIGQGFLLATPLQMANAYSALAAGGELRSPRLVADQPAAPLGALSLSAATQSTILDAMRRVTSSPAGTAAYAFQGERLPIAAKTGSAENENPDAHAWFVGFLPPEAPTLLVLIMVEGGQHGGTVAAPLARSLIDFAFPLDR